MPTIVVYPDAGTGGTTCDGYVRRAGVSESPSTIINALAGQNVDTSGTTAPIELRADASPNTNLYQRLARYFATFDTSSINDDATIQTVFLSIYPTTILSGLGHNALVVVDSFTASNNTLTNTDYSQRGTTALSGTIPTSSASTGSYNAFGFNLSGNASINKSGISKYAIVLDWDRAVNFTGTWSDDAITGITFYTADQTGTTQDPKLEITFENIVDLEDSFVVSEQEVDGLVYGESKDETLAMTEDYEQKPVFVYSNDLEDSFSVEDLVEGYEVYSVRWTPVGRKNSVWTKIGRK